MSTPSRDRRWTLEELHALPEDSNTYELIDGELFVTPAPTDEHGDICARLNAILVPYVLAQGLGLVYVQCRASHGWWVRSSAARTVRPAPRGWCVETARRATKR